MYLVCIDISKPKKSIQYWKVTDVTEDSFTWYSHPKDKEGWPTTFEKMKIWNKINNILQFLRIQY